MINDFVSILFPRVCVGCKRSLISAEDFLCTICKANLPFTRDHLNPDNRLIKKFAFESLVRFAASYLYFHRKGVSQKLLYEIKYNGRKEWARIIGSWYGKILASHINVDFIVPVPLHRSKSRQRGYNQSTCFAQGLATALRIPVKENIVNRKTHTQTQTRKSKTDRWKNVENVFGDVKEDISGKKVLLVDDVITTGATLGMLCRQFEAVDVVSIAVVSIARPNASL